MRLYRPFPIMALAAGILITLAGCGGSGADGGTGGGTGGGTATGPATSQMGGARQGVAPTLAGQVATFAGRPAATPADGTGAGARFTYPTGVTSDGTDLYVTDTAGQTIRKVIIATGKVTTLAGSDGVSGSVDGIGSAARFTYPTAVACDGVNLYVVETTNHTIRKVVIATGAVTTLAGSAGASGSVDGVGGAARFNGPQGIAVLDTTLYVTDTGNNTIRTVRTDTGQVATLAGSAGEAGTADGVGTAARFMHPTMIATDGARLYVGDVDIRIVLPADATVTTLYAEVGGWWSDIAGMAVSGGNLYMTMSSAIRTVALANGATTQFAGDWYGGSTDGRGNAARFNAPSGITVIGGDLYLADTDNNTIRKVAIATAEVTTLAGSSSGADGSRFMALFNYPTGITTDGASLFVADAENRTIRRIHLASGAVTTLAGQAGQPDSTDGVGSAARFQYPVGITTDGTNLYVTDTSDDTVRKIVIATGEVTTLAGRPGWLGSGDGTGTAARFNAPAGITTDGTSLYVADTNNSIIRRIVLATGAVTTLAGSAGETGAVDGVGSAARFNYPGDITTDGTSLYVADTNNSTIRRVAIATGAVTTLAGSAGARGVTDGAGGEGRFNYPCGITTDGTNLYVADTNNNTVRRVVIATGEVTTVAGAAGTAGLGDGFGTTALFNTPLGITTDGTALYVADGENNIIRSVR